MSDRGIPIIGKIPNLAAKGQKIAAVDAMTRDVKRHLSAIADHFDDPRITLVVRAQGQDLILTNDTGAEALAALQREEKKVN